MSSWTTTTFTAHEEIPIPLGIPRAQVLSLLHNPVYMIMRNSRVISHRLLPADHKSAHKDGSGAGVPTYEITDKMTFLPEAIWPAGSVTYTMSFEDTPDGLKHVLKAAMSMVSKATHTVVERDGGLVLTEDSVVEVNRLVAGHVKKNMHDTAAGNFGAFVKGLEGGRWAAKEGEVWEGGGGMRYTVADASSHPS
ncbi:hypothetical protein MMC17_008238 [Xylographa soralifera]|nr:hypothetical protein [Xylographa soralifera]